MNFEGDPFLPTSSLTMKLHEPIYATMLKDSDERKQEEQCRCRTHLGCDADKNGGG